MNRRRDPPPQRELFGSAPKAAPDCRPVTLAMREIATSSTPKAFFLVPPPGGRGKPGFVPRASVSRGEGPSENHFTMPRWLAAERGWL